MITQEILKQYVSYNPDSGIFTSTGSKYSNKEPGSPIGTVHKTKGYRYINVKGKTYRACRLAFLYMTGSFPIHQVDHINQIKNDDRWINLRDIEPIKNSWNRPIYKTNKSGYTGVIWQKSCNKWQVLCRSNGKQVYLGLYDDVHEAGKIATEWYSKNR